MKKKAVSLLCLALACVMCACSNAAGSSAGAPQQRNLEEFLLQTSVSLAGRMDMLAETPSYVQLYSSSTEVTEPIAEYGAGTYETPQRAFVLEVAMDDFLAAAGEEIDFSGLPEDRRHYIERRLAISLPNLINGQQSGANALVAASILSLTESYQKPDSFSGNLSVLIDFGTVYAVMAGFVESEEGTVMVTAIPVYLSDSMRETITSPEALGELFSQSGIAGITVTEISQETIDKVFS